MKASILLHNIEIELTIFKYLENNLISYLFIFMMKKIPCEVFKEYNNIIDNQLFDFKQIAVHI
jgi:hypothetical protein